MTRFSAVTFDLWNTLLVEAGAGLIAPRAERWREILRGTFDVEVEALEAAHQACLLDYQEAWTRNEQFRSPEATANVCRRLGIDVDRQTRQALVRSFHDAGLSSELKLVGGAPEVLEALRDAGIQTAIICDIGLTPSSALAARLRDLGVLQLVDVCAWSDEFGAYKPDPSIFEWTLRQLDTCPERAGHVGDRLRTDVGGARASGMASIRFRGVFDDPAPLAEADYVIDDLRAVLDLVFA